MLAAQPGEKGVGTAPPAGAVVGATEGGAGVRAAMGAPTLLPFHGPPSPLRARAREDSRLTTFSDSLLQFRVEVRKGLLPVNSSSMELRGPETESCSPVMVSETWGDAGRGRGGLNEKL